MVFVSFFSIFVIIGFVIQPRTRIFNPPFLSLTLVWLFGNFSLEIWKFQIKNDLWVSQFQVYYTQFVKKKKKKKIINDKVKLAK